MVELQDANTNPWYVLMTLYGEQKDDGLDSDLHAQNRAVWNAWACQGLDDEAAAALAQQAGVDVAETRGWAEMSTRVMEQYRAEMARRNKRDEFDPSGFLDSMPTIIDCVDCRLVHFVNPVILSGFIFTHQARFDRAEFAQYADFKSAVFTQRACFYGVRFTSTADFNDATFSEISEFDSAAFFRLADFHRTTFSQAAAFFMARFDENAVFAEATFTQTADFRSVTFSQDAVFCKAIFTRDVSYKNARFTQDAVFKSAKFEGAVELTKAEFGKSNSRGKSWPVFTSAVFDKVVSFRSATFANRYPVLVGTQFREGVVVSAKDEFWPKDGKADVYDSDETREEAKESCAALRHALTKQGLPEEEHFFFRREMGFSRRIGGWWQRLPYRLYGSLSNYGESLARPCLWLLALWAVPMVILGVAFWLMPAQSHWSLWQAPMLSISNILKIFGFHLLYFDVAQIQQLHWGLQLMGALQTIAALPLLFFLGLALRKRFRLR